MEQKNCSVRTELEETKKEVQKLKTNLLHWKISMMIAIITLTFTISLVRIDLRARLRENLIIVRQCLEVCESILLDYQGGHRVLRQTDSGVAPVEICLVEIH